MTQREQPKAPELPATLVENHFLFKELETCPAGFRIAVDC